MKKQNNLQKFVEYSRLKNNPWLKFLLFVILLNSLITFAGVMIPRTIVVIIQNNSNSLMKILSFVCGLELALLLLKTISTILKGKLKNCSEELFRESYADLALKQSLLLYECSISSENLGLLEGGKYGIWEIPPLSNWLEKLGSSIASILLNGVLVCIFDWKLLIIPVAIQILLRPFYRSVMKIEIDNAKRLLPENRAFGWYCRLVSDFRFGEDLRIYQASDLILDRCQKLMQKIYRINQKAYTHKGILLGIIKFLFQFQIVVVAVMLGFRCMKGMEIADFILLFSAISVISVASNDLVEGINRLKKMDALLDPFFKFIE